MSRTWLRICRPSSRCLTLVELEAPSAGCLGLAANLRSATFGKDTSCGGLYFILSRAFWKTPVSFSSFGWRILNTMAGPAASREPPLHGPSEHNLSPVSLNSHSRSTPESRDAAYAVVGEPHASEVLPSCGCQVSTSQARSEDRNPRPN